jgi:hypothetical protein
MTPVFCRVKHDPKNGTYGDCLRASVASLLDIEPPELVPHFADGGASAELTHERLRTWALSQGLVPFIIAYAGEYPLEDVLQAMENSNPGIAYLLFGRTSENPHVVCCGKGKVIHDSAWVKSPIVAPTIDGYWVVMIFVSEKMLF